MAIDWNLFPIGGTGFGADNPLKPPEKKKSVWETLTERQTIKRDDVMAKIPGVATVNTMYDFFKALLDSDNWIRLGIIIIGIVFLSAGLFMLGNKAAVAVVDKVKDAAG